MKANSYQYRKQKTLSTNLTLLLGSLLMSSVSQSAPFTIEPENSWNIINDSVMGGGSSSSVSYDNKVATFSGELSLDNNGGFASIRARLTTKVPAKATHVYIRVKGDGRKYQLRLRTDTLQPTHEHSIPSAMNG